MSNFYTITPTSNGRFGVQSITARDTQSALRLLHKLYPDHVVVSRYTADDLAMSSAELRPRVRAMNAAARIEVCPSVKDERIIARTSAWAGVQHWSTMKRGS
jgi:hypothetical protein